MTDQNQIECVDDIERLDDGDEPFVHPGRSVFGAALFGLGVAQMRSAAATVGSPEAIADCQRRREDAQRIAQHAADANEGKDWNAESLQGEYDTDSEGDEN